MEKQKESTKIVKFPPKFGMVGKSEIVESKVQIARNQLLIVKIFQGEHPRTARLPRAAFGSHERGAPFSTLAPVRHEPPLRHCR